METKPGDRPDIEQAIMNISEFVVRGKAARRNGVVRWHQLSKTCVVMATALTGVGVSHPLLSIIMGKEVSVQQLAESLPRGSVAILVLGVTLFLGIAIVQHLQKEKEVEKKAILSIALAESYEVLGRNFELALRYPEPLDQLVPLKQDSMVLFKYYGNLMPPSEECQLKIKDEVKKLINVHCGNWSPVPPPSDRR